MYMERANRKGSSWKKILPPMALSDCITWAVLLWIFFNLLWLKFMEVHIPQWVGAAIATALALLFIFFWPREAGEVEEDEEEIIGQE
ncbi:Uncharacterized [Moorella glycerini]|uniref:Uncharacterized protein n=1 Tax=Neomoorella stamsii TaxID=1266720 RepID=A0A9X7P7H9_9FIRM|nr:MULTISPECIES: hypothetical protein [Moorella]PRR76453.1 hypothetical protein MOST_06210 [Moorella stamsii]CEP66978.1 Uncharacterized [Moorella glycerini]